MELCVSDILKLPILADAKVLAGEKGLDREVSQVTVGEVPDIGDWLTGNELVLSTFFGVETTTDAQVEFTRKIIKANAAGLLVKPGRFISEVDPQIISLGKRHNFPIVEVPSEVRWTHIIAELSERIVGAHVSLLRRSRDIHQSLLDVVIDGGSWQSIADTTSQLLGKPVVLEDSFLELLAQSIPDNTDADLIEKYEVLRKSEKDAGRPEPPPRGERYQRTPLNGKKEFPAKATVPIMVSRDVLGYVSSFESDAPLNDLDLVALESAATVAPLQLGRELVRMAAEPRRRATFVEHLVRGASSGGPPRRGGRGRNSGCARAGRGASCRPRGGPAGRHGRQ